MSLLNASLAAALLAAACLLGGPLAPAEARLPIVTDRPDIAESSLVVGPRVYQQEQAVQAETAGGVTSWLFPSLHRLGLTDTLELRVETPLASLTGGRPAFEELAIGGKWHVIDGGELGEWPSLAVLGHANLTASGYLEPIAKLLVDTTLPLDVSLGLNLGTSLPGGQATPVMTYAGSLGRDLTDMLRIYGEWSGEQGSLNGQMAGVDGGLTWLLTEDMQLDMAVYKGLTPNAPDWYLTSGLSTRFGGR